MYHSQEVMQLRLLKQLHMLHKVQVAEAEVEEATSALKLTEDGFEADEDAGDLADFDYEY